MATATAGIEWSGTVIALTASGMAAGAVTLTSASAFSPTMAPHDIQLKLKGSGDASASGNVVLSYKWVNATLVGSATSTDTLNLGWQFAGVFDFNSAATFVQTVMIPVGGTHLRLQAENSTAGTVTFSVLAIPQFSKSVSN